MKNYHAFQIRFIRPTDTKPSRISINSLRFRQHIIVNIEDNDYWGQAVITLQQLGFNLIGQAEANGGCILFSDTFKPLK